MKILGAGISGLTSAVNLALEGYDVEVYEKNPEIGMQIKENAQMLPNWLTRESDIIKELERCNIKINPVSRINKVHLFLSGKKLTSLRSSKPFGYTLIRGGNKSLEMNLKKQAQKLGVVIHTNCDKKRADVVATGHKKMDAIIYGKVCKGNFNPNEVYVFIDFKHFPGGYAYLYPHNKNRASIVVGNLARSKIDPKESMKKVFEHYEDILYPFDLSLLYEFGGFSGFSIPTTAVRGDSLYAGEAAGFQDPLFGFGMKYAIKSGYLAARSIIEKRNYDRLWKGEFISEMNRLFAMRNFLYRMDERMITSLSNNMNYFDAEKLNSLMKSKKFSLMLHCYNQLSRVNILRVILLSFGMKLLRHV